MTPELTVLALTALIYLPLKLGDLAHSRWGDCASAHLDTVVYFAIPALIISYADKSDLFTALASTAFLGACLLHIPARFLGRDRLRRFLCMIATASSGFLLLWCLL